ncbi:trimethylamine methyltransferase family protein, partial [SAR116 cluster bacterium]|nr:trimethylamine methyltransferase family protein [SAR116 cluster bacterium]
MLAWSLGTNIGIQMSPNPEPPSPESPNARRRRRAGRRAQNGGASDLAANTPPLAHLSATGGWLKLLDDAALSSIHHAALTILAETGFSEAPDEVIDLVTAAGGGLNAAGRLLFPNDLVTTALANLPRQLTLHARRDGADLHLGGDG